MAATLISYDWIITLDKEVGNNNDNLCPWISPSYTQYKSEHIWRKKWTLPNSLCIIARYFGLAFILFLTIFVSMSSVREVNLDFFASVATQGHWFIRLLAFLLFTLTKFFFFFTTVYFHDTTGWPVTGCVPVNVSQSMYINLIPLLVSSLTIISMIIILMSVANPGVTAVMITFIPLLYQIAPRRASLGIKALP
ncbi:hypothetical protein BU17DRAFT_63643 [Hysterangium stoloniferum]|nr:hypothetical protein BU17DRAFT_63643 [Hysterangium stoloniferum]